MSNEQILEPVKRLTRDIAKASVTLTDSEARFLVDSYYAMQENRKRSSMQMAALEKAGEPNAVMAWLSEQDETIEGQIKRALDKYTDQKYIGRWMKSITGIGPVIAAGMMAHINIRKCECVPYKGMKEKPVHDCYGISTAGHIYRYAGLEPTVVWEKGKLRPWNAALKTLCWKVGQSFMKFSNKPECFYGQIYRQKKDYYIKKNEAGDYREEALSRKDKVGKNTEAYKHLSEGKLPPGQIDARARRYAVKIFLSHLHEIWYRHEFGVEPPKPYAISILGHGDYIAPPNMDVK
jgi:hypothetical protein